MRIPRWHFRRSHFSPYRNTDSKSFVGLKLVRTLNERLLALLMLAAILIGGLAYGLHRVQVTRCGDALLRFANLARERKDLPEAIEFLERYISLVPENNDGPLAELGLLQAEIGRYRQASQNFETVLLHDGQRDDLRKRLVEVSIAMRQYPEALRHLDILLKTSPNDVELWGLAGRCQIAMGEYPAAIDALERAIKLDAARLETPAIIRPTCSAAVSGWRKQTPFWPRLLPMTSCSMIRPRQNQRGPNRMTMPSMPLFRMHAVHCQLLQTTKP